MAFTIIESFLPDKNVRKKIIYFLNSIISGYCLIIFYILLESGSQTWHSSQGYDIIIYYFNLETVIFSVFVVFAYSWFVISVLLLVEDFIIFSKCKQIVRLHKKIIIIILCAILFILLGVSINEFYSCNMSLVNGRLEFHGCYEKIMFMFANIIGASCAIFFITLQCNKKLKCKKSS